ncbi:hypothetical protein V6N11_057903 [Hibiscus sabdariffa]|uniref:Uncharacterized protein n=1 Tax=Hibiscus sabdariffa TaxID=183260 RepID=A0ABR2P472_9ROSI
MVCFRPSPDVWISKDEEENEVLLYKEDARKVPCGQALDCSLPPLLAQASILSTHEVFEENDVTVLMEEDDEIIKFVVAGSTPSYSLESKLCDCKRAAAIKREARRCTDRVKEEDGGSLVLMWHFTVLTWQFTISDESLLFVSSSSNAFESTTSDTYLGWNKASEIVIDGGGEVETVERTDKVITVILLGWLGGYDSSGIHAVNFLVKLRDFLCLDPISILDHRIIDLKNGLITWGSDKEEDDCERCFIFQTFSNTRWLGELIHSMLI